MCSSNLIYGLMYMDFLSAGSIEAEQKEIILQSFQWKVGRFFLYLGVSDPDNWHSAHVFPRVLSNKQKSLVKKDELASFLRADGESNGERVGFRVLNGDGQVVGNPAGK